MNKFHAQLAVSQEGVESGKNRLVVECSCGDVFSTLVYKEQDTQVACKCGQLYGWFIDTLKLEALSQGDSERQRLLEEVSLKPIRSFVQLDYFQDHEMYATPTREFNRTGCVRLLIPAEGWEPAHVIYGVAQLLEWLESKESPFPLSNLQKLVTEGPAIAEPHPSEIPF